jgi:hypothetical protein
MPRSTLWATNGLMHRSKKQLFDHLVGAAEHIGGHHHHIQGGGATQSADATGSDPAGATTDPLLQALAGASSTSVSNSDGSTNHLITYATARR